MRLFVLNLSRFFIKNTRCADVYYLLYENFYRQTLLSLVAIEKQSEKNQIFVLHEKPTSF